jgi:hypothetical protein
MHWVIDSSEEVLLLESETYNRPHHTPPGFSGKSNRQTTKAYSDSSVRAGFNKKLIKGQISSCESLNATYILGLFVGLYHLVWQPRRKKMAWVQVGSFKINTANVCYIENKEDSVLIHFHGQWAGNPLSLKENEAKMLWKHIKGEDVMYTKDKGSAYVLPKRISAAPMPVVLEAGEKAGEKSAEKPPEKPRTPAPVGATAGVLPPRAHQSSSSQPHTPVHMNQHKPSEARKA